MAKTFGKTVRRARLLQDVTLQQLAKRVGLSAGYLSQIERDNMLPPIAEKTERIAEALDLDKDELLAQGGMIAADLVAIIIKRPRKIAALIRSAKR
jgi:transcriptional regulator with XRE-family HTH domain